MAFVSPVIVADGLRVKVLAPVLILHVEELPKFTLVFTVRLLPRVKVDAEPLLLTVKLFNNSKPEAKGIEALRPELPPMIRLELVPPFIKPPELFISPLTVKLEAELISRLPLAKLTLPLIVGVVLAAKITLFPAPEEITTLFKIVALVGTSGPVVAPAK